MGTTTDTFARFMDVLAGSLDDHDASGEHLGAGDPMRWVAEPA